MHSVSQTLLHNIYFCLSATSVWCPHTVLTAVPLLVQHAYKVTSVCMQGVHQTSTVDTSLEAKPADATSQQIPTAKLCIEQALHLAMSPAPTDASQPVHTAAAGQALSGSGSAGLVRVEYLWQGVPATTPAVGVSEAGSAVWQYMVHLPKAGPGPRRGTCLLEGGSFSTALLDLQV